MKSYYNFGEDKKYLKNIKVKIVADDDIEFPCYRPKEETIYIKKGVSKNLDVIAHEQSHAIVDKKYKIWEEITSTFCEKYEDEYNMIVETVTDEIWDYIEKKFHEAGEKLFRINEDKIPTQTQFEKKCIVNIYCYRDFYKSLNKLSRKVAERFKEEYGDRVGQFVCLVQEIQGLDELLAHAVGEQVLGGDAIFYKGYYLFGGSATIYKLWEMLKKKGYPYVTDMLFSQRVKKAKELVKKI